MTKLRIPLACSLSTSDAERQILNWTNVRNRSLDTFTIEHGIAMTFKPEIAALVEDLAARESACCTFLSAKTIRSDEMIRLEITSEDLDVLPFIKSIAASASTPTIQ